uniref:Retrotransposon gag domain-containing protein n=1 Tax=Lactuca sativa TaxID=4236 RepID=A0A9R1UNE6_LACSA|nr:hypothetical protein LSAT_V11C800388460 [Lactuca sativa]
MADTQAILGCRKQEYEPLSTYVRSFNKTTLNTPEKVDKMVIVAFTYGLRRGVLFKKLVGKQPSSRKEMMERFHRYIKQEDTKSKNLKTEQWEQVKRAPYTRVHIPEGTRYQGMK